MFKKDTKFSPPYGDGTQGRDSKSIAFSFRPLTGMVRRITSASSRSARFRPLTGMVPARRVPAAITARFRPLTGMVQGL